METIKWENANALEIGMLMEMADCLLYTSDAADD